MDKQKYPQVLTDFYRIDLRACFQGLPYLLKLFPENRSSRGFDCGRN